MTHQVLKIFLMGRNNILRYLSILIFFTLLSACQHGWVEERNIYLGEIEIGYEVWNLSEIDPSDYTFFHTHQMAKATLGSEKGFGMLENLVIGRHDPSGFKDFFDGAK